MLLYGWHYKFDDDTEVDEWQDEKNNDNDVMRRKK